MIFYLFLSTRKKAKFCPHLKYGMNTELFRAKTEALLKYSPRSERHFLKSTFKRCEYCTTEVKNQRIECQPYRLGTEHAYFKHICKPCNFVLFDGSMVKESTRHRRPDAPMLVVNASDQDDEAPPRRRSGRGRTRAIQTPAGLFESLTESARHYNKTPCMMLHTMRKNPKEYYYI
jgi:hypothetical protein